MIERTRVRLVLALLVVAGFRQRTVARRRETFPDGGLRLADPDGWHHLRQVEQWARHFPERMRFDPYALHPGGMDVPVAPLFDGVCAAVAFVLGGPDAAPRVVAIVPAVCGALLCLPAFVLGRRLGGTAGGLVVALIAATLPGQLLVRTMLGFADHHAIEALLAAVAVAFLASSLARPDDDDRAALRLAAFAGVALGLHQLSWSGGALLVAALAVAGVAVAIADALRRRPLSPSLARITTAFGVALLVFLPFARSTPTGTVHAAALGGAARVAPDARWTPWSAGIAGALGCKLLGTESSALGTLGRLDDLSEPALHALARHRWPDGVPLWLPAHSGAECPVVQDDLLLEFGAAVHPRMDRILALDRDDVLATLHDRPGRRRRILAQIGRQVPLERAFDRWISDESVVWGRDDQLSGLAGAGSALLLTGAPGMGKSTLLKELARAAGGMDVVTAGAGELPASDHVFVDGADRLDAPALLRLVKDAHWLRTTRTPMPSITIAVRPETRLAIERAAPGMFSTYELPPRALASLREQARVMLGWVGIEAEAPGSYDRLAFLGSGNPTVLFHFCRALTMILARAARPHRRFSPADVDQAWRDETLLSTLRRMFWEPVQAYDGAAGVLRTVYDFGGSGALDPELLAWAVRESLGDRDAGWVDERVRLLGGYGLVRSAPEGVRPASGGIGVLARGWLAVATDDAKDGRA